jgi:hypothetical protein
MKASQKVSLLSSNCLGNVKNNGESTMKVKQVRVLQEYSRARSLNHDHGRGKGIPVGFFPS